MKKKLLTPLFLCLLTATVFSQGVVVHSDNFESTTFPSAFSKSGNASWNSGGGSDYTGTFWDGFYTSTSSTQTAEISTTEHYNGSQSLKLTIPNSAADLSPKLTCRLNTLGGKIANWGNYHVNLFMKIQKPDGTAFDGQFSIFKNSFTLVGSVWKSISFLNGYAENTDATNISLEFKSIGQDYVVYIDSVVVSRAYATWTGDVSEFWNVDGNWVNGIVPQETENVYIPSTATRMCTVNSTGVKCNDLLIQNGATLTVNSGSDITINSTTTNSGTITNNGTFTTISNGTYQSIGGVMTGTGTYTLESGATLSVDNANGLSSTAGAIRCTTRNYNAAANYILSGSTAQTTSGAPGSPNNFPAQVNNLTINDAAGVVLTANLNVNGNLVLSSGLLTTNPWTLKVKGNVTGSGSVDAVYFNGTTEQTCSSTVTGLASIDPTSKVTNTGSIGGQFYILSDPAGTGTFINNGTVTGYLSVRQFLENGRHFYVTSPFADATAPNQNINRYYEYIEPGDNSNLTEPGSTAYWKGLATGFNMQVGKGYIADAGSETTIEFAGYATLNSNASYSIPVSRTNSADKAGFNLVGNPYTAYLDWSAVIADPANANIGTSMWFRTQNTDGHYTFATHNGTSGQTVTGAAKTSITKYIPPMQGFWVRVNDGHILTSVTFRKTMLSHSSDASNKFKAPAVNTTPVIRLQVSNGTYTDEALIYQNDNALNTIDNYDSPKMMNNNADMPELFCVVDGEKLVINGLKTMEAGTELPIGFLTEKSNSFSFRMSQLNNIPSDIQVVLKDKVADKEQVMAQNTVYNFTSDAVNTTSRFSLLFRSTSSSTGLQKPVVAKKYGVYTNSSNAIVVDLYNDNPSAQVELYNIAGTRLGVQKVNSSNTVLDLQPASGVYLVKIKDGDYAELHRVILR